MHMTKSRERCSVWRGIYGRGPVNVCSKHQTKQLLNTRAPDLHLGWKQTTPIISSACIAPTPASSMANTGPAHSAKSSSKLGAESNILLTPSFPDGPAAIMSLIASHVSVPNERKGKERKGERDLLFRISSAVEIQPPFAYQPSRYIFHHSYHDLRTKPLNVGT